MLLLLAACGGRLAAPPMALKETADPMPITGEALTLSAQAMVGGLPGSPGDYDYQWMKDGQDLPQDQGATLAFPSIGPGDAGSYQVRVTPRPTAHLAAPRAVGGTPVENPTEAILSLPFDVEPVDHPWAVTSLADSGPGTLRAVLGAMTATPGVQGIRFDLDPAQSPELQLQSDLPPIRFQVRILGPAGTTLVIDGMGQCRPFFVDGGDLTLDNLIVRNGLGKGGDAPGGGGGAAGMGGGLFLNKGSATLRRVTFQGNKALGGTSLPGGDGENGGGGGFGGDSPASGGTGADGGFLVGKGGIGHLDGTATTDAGGGPGLGSGAGGGAARGGLLTDPVAGWADNLPGGEASFGGGGGFSVGPQGGGGDGSTFGGGGGGSGGGVLGTLLPGSAAGAGGVFGGDGKAGNGVTAGLGGGGGGMGGAIFFRAGTLSLVECQFLFNRAEGGGGGEPGLGKGGAVFVYKFDKDSATTLLPMLEAQTYAGNLATNLVESPAFDNDNFYVAQTLLVAQLGSPLDLTYRLYRLNLKYGLPWRR